jgi:beta-mannosidase
MYSDPWPTGSWSVVDWYGLPKAAYYAAKRAARPLQIGWKVRPDENGWQLIACNDTLKEFSGGLVFGEETVSGEQKWTRELDVSIPANASTVLAEIETAEFSGAADSILFTELDCGGETRSNVFFPNFWKDLPWPEPNLEITGFQTLENGEVEVTIKTENFARSVHLEGLNEGCADGLPVYLSDSFFDMRAGETRTIRLQSTASVDTGNLRIAHWLTEWS